MALKLRPTLGRHWRMRERRIYETPGGSTVWLILIAYRHRSDDLLGSRGDQEEAKAQFQKSWDAGEGVGEAGRGTVSAISGRGRRKHG